MVQVSLESSLCTESIRFELEQYGIQLSDGAPWSLSRSEEVWQLQDREGRKLKIDFDHNKKDYQRSHKGSGELIARALGIKERVHHVVDLTAGLGIDSVFLAQLGFQVIAIERNPLLYFLLRQAQKSSKRPEVQKIEFVLSDSNEFLANFKSAERASFYFDPMYPEKKKSALPRQEMVLFRHLVGDDADARKVLARALLKDVARVVVKRPVRSEPIVDSPDFQLESKLVRYDVYYPLSQVREGKGNP